jgi:ATP-binding cassette subfamily B protein
MEGRSTIIIAHRLSTVRKADCILVLAQVQVREQGTHADLIQQNGLYARLYEVGLGVSSKGLPSRHEQASADVIGSQA